MLIKFQQRTNSSNFVARKQNTAEKLLSKLNEHKFFSCAVQEMLYKKQIKDFPPTIYYSLEMKSLNTKAVVLNK